MSWQQGAWDWEEEHGADCEEEHGTDWEEEHGANRTRGAPRRSLEAPFGSGGGADSGERPNAMPSCRWPLPARAVSALSTLSDRSARSVRESGMLCRAAS